LAGDITFWVLIILTLHIDVRLDAFDGADRIRRPIDRDPVHTLQCGEHFGPETFIKHWPAGSLVDEIISCDGNEQRIAKGTGPLQVAYMTQVQQVESAVRLYDNSARLAQPLSDYRELSDRPALVARARGNDR